MVLILNEQSAWLYLPILTDSLKMDYPFQIACVQPPPPLRKKRKRGVCEGGGDCTQTSLRRMIHFLALVWKRPTTKFPCPVFLMIQERTVQNDWLPWLVRGPHYSARLMYSGSRGPRFAWEDAVQGLGMAIGTLRYSGRGRGGRQPEVKCSILGTN